MQTVFIAGSISIRRLHEKVKNRIDNIIRSIDLNVVVGDADGVDTSIQNYLSHNSAQNVTVYCSGDNPRNNVANWPVKNIYPKASQGTRAYFTAKDIEMARASDYGLMIWDCKSPGTLSNVMELLKYNKKSVVFVNKNKDFINVCDLPSLEKLLTFMSDHARKKADEKIDISSRMAYLGQKQFDLAM